MSKAQGKPAQTRWGIVTTAKEVPDLLLAFAAHHASIGASRIHLYLDDPDPALARRLEDIPGVEVTQCDTTYWQMIRGQRPSAQENRQVENAMDAYGRTDVDWLIHIDADEFISPRANIVNELTFVPKEFHFVELEVRERVYTPEHRPETIFSGEFRVPLNRRARAARALFGDMAPFTTRGFSGHCAGKSFVRVGLEHLLMGIHVPRLRKVGNERLMSLISHSATLLHFDGLTPAHWVSKMVRYGAQDTYLKSDRLGEHRRRQLEYVMARKGDRQAVEHLHDLMKVVKAEDAARLRALGVLEPADVDPSLGLHLFGLADQVDLSVAYFDGYDAPAEEELKRSA
ncbi:MAG: glycosyltransferase family 2 protein [Paracoccaceae bacterium]|nr:glycosyltransferase family 2 protein [Paracoccaceae bacterium]MDP7186335.1 glycosyltransferase family 2 protein [Paracoccaceae bacterium]